MGRSPIRTHPVSGKRIGPEHSALYIANEMAVVHNCIIRGLNAIYLQAHLVRETQDIQDFQDLIYAWRKWVQAHHSLVDDAMFPMLADAAGRPGLLQESSDQHQEFVSGIDQLLELSLDQVSGYSYRRVRGLINFFAPAMHRHFADEVEALVTLKEFDSSALMNAYSKAEEGIRHIDDEAKARIFPLALGVRDVAYEGGNAWPNFPPAMEKDIIHRLVPLHAGAWRFLPCEFDGQVRPSPM
ncbi:hypothetical protein M409DRAFT_25315 [Zasmidium cellare ATCC 36951]|uniref:Hemerythrin-like domain-containing protein n=1 Tax=Zasmidium cellare ATCC 36951 TaxID=1080233 RepID=A0A6A6CE41_ZASCE|nr:uncharacterized protein M409DRAFT_25315 [Zasmidium cellare ATCC 36951]KAF2164438.1 hypothetical protein M409DRAFT_25315 [Zasmidium cellare ATCC 36951]